MYEKCGTTVINDGSNFISALIEIFKCAWCALIVIFIIMLINLDDENEGIGLSGDGTEVTQFTPLLPPPTMWDPHKNGIFVKPVYLQIINADANVFQSQWNNHFLHKIISWFTLLLLFYKYSIMWKLMWFRGHVFFDRHIYKSVYIVLNEACAIIAFTYMITAVYCGTLSTHLLSTIFNKH